LRELSERLRTISTINLSYKDFCNNFCSDLEWLADRGDEHNTVDTFAKYCYLRDTNSLARLKFTLSLFFTIKQFIDKKRDNRYQNFLIKNLDRRQIFPSNIKILNWNYDCQIQLAGENFRQESFSYRYGATVHSPPLVDYYPTLGGEFNINARVDYFELSLVHLNGIAGFYYYEPTTHILNYFLNAGIRDINHLFDMVLMDKEKKHQLLTFAFENNDGVNNIIRNRIPYAKNIIANTDYLVIIGYSFPYDNIETDNKIFDTLKEGRQLKGIYYQDPHKSGDFLRNLFNLNDEITITNITSVDGFYIPSEAKMPRKLETRV
jgi:hypothetical protein